METGVSSSIKHTAKSTFTNRFGALLLTLAVGAKLQDSTTKDVNNKPDEYWQDGLC